MVDQPADISRLSPAEKRALLADLLRQEAAESAAAHPMSYGQRALWFVYKLAPASPAYTIVYAGRVRGELDVAALERAAQALHDRHPILRTTYTERDGRPVQLVHRHVPARIARHRIESAADLDDWIHRETDRPFDLATGPVLRLTLLDEPGGGHVLLLAVHHIAVDFWSVDIMLDDLQKLYAAEHGAPTPPPPAERYADYADQQARMLDGPAGERLWEYWRDQLRDAPPTLRLPTDRPRPAVQTYNGALYRFDVDAAATTRFKQAGRAIGATPYMTVLAAYAVLLHRYTGQDDLVIGSPFACRDREGVTGVMGYFSNPVALRFDLHDDPTFSTLLHRVKDTVLGAIAHQDYPFPLLVERLRPPRDAGRTPVFQASLAWDQVRLFTDETGDQAGRLHLDSVHIGQGGAPFDLLMQVSGQGDALHCGLQYNTDLFDEATIARMARHFARLIDHIGADPDAPVSGLQLLTAEESEQLARWNDTRVDYGGPAGLHDLVARTVARMPDATAVTFDGRELSYAELDRRADDLARRLQLLGVGAATAGADNTVVPVLLERSEDLVVALLGVLKAGGAFLPLDPAQPTHRMAAMLADIPDVPVCVTQRRHLEQVPAAFTGTRLCLDQLPATAAAADATSSAGSGAGAGSIAYVIYTSGSTGTPKGAVNTHAAICNRLLWMQDAYRLTPDDRVLHKTPMSFDPSVWEIFWPLIVGARVVIAKPEGHKDAAYLARTIVEQAVTTTHFVPSMLRRFLAEPAAAGCTGLSQVFCSGEALPYDLRDQFFATLPAELYNLYGPTEAAIDVTHFHCERGSSRQRVPIGRPIANVRIHLLDEHLRPVPVGVPGELFIGGVAVGPGYLNRPETTAASFLTDPFAPAGSGQLLYRTGDLARYLPDGNIEYLGRIDSQVKINGFRIEPGEIEAALTKHPAVTESAVVAVGGDDTANPLLVARIVCAGGPAPDTAELRRFLLDELPAAMVPAVFTPVDALPLTANGKVDRRALAEAAGVSVARPAEFVAPRNRTEQVLAEIWCDILGLAQVGVNDDFFALGGASTQALEVSVRAADAGLDLRPESMFVYGTIAELAAEYGPIADPGAADTGVTASPDRAAEPEPTPVAAAATPAGPARPRQPVAPNTVIESLGVYLPPRAVSTEQVLADCVNEVRIPLERLTGITSRRMAGTDEFSIDLARKAAGDCLSRSSYRPEDIDLVIACNISRYDGPERFSFEPGTAARLREQCGLSGAVCFDINNACAGMFTGITIADAFLKSDLIRSALVVSGEYITHITETAQKEIDGALDPRLACLTVGDAGAAVVLERGPGDRVGFHDIDLATLSEYAKLCIGKATDSEHGGAIMVTDSVKQTAIAVKHSVPYVAGVMARHGWQPETCDHLLMHQTSEASINDAIRAINGLLGRDAVNRNNTINNLAERGNTATTTHFVALADYIRNGRINSGDNVVFSITGSGQTIGTALYTFDDLPDRMRRAGDTAPARRPAATGRRELPATPRVRVDAVGLAPAGSAPPSSIRFATEAAAACLDRSGIDRSALGFVIHTGVYRDDFLSEPAVASLVAGELGINAVVDSPDAPKTFDFDLLNGAVGFLNACHVAAGMIAAGKTEHVMVVTSEVENNPPDSGFPRTGVTETGSAVLLSRSDDGDTAAGFGRFVFTHHPEYAAALTTYTQQQNGRTRLQVQRDPNLANIYLNCLPGAAKELLALDGLAPADIALVLPPHLPSAALDELAAQIGVPRARFVDPAAGRPATDPFTSSVPLGLEQIRARGLAEPGDIALILTVGSGVEVGCTTYRF